MLGVTCDTVLLTLLSYAGVHGDDAMEGRALEDAVVDARTGRGMYVMESRWHEGTMIQSLPMVAVQLVVRGSRRAPTPPPDGPTGSAESARPGRSFLSLLFRTLGFLTPKVEGELHATVHEVCVVINCTIVY